MNIETSTDEILVIVNSWFLWRKKHVRVKSNQNFNFKVEIL